MIINEKAREAKKEISLLRKEAEKLGNQGTHPNAKTLNVGDTVYTIIATDGQRGRRFTIDQKYTITGFGPCGHFDTDPNVKSIPGDSDKYAVEVVGINGCLLSADCVYLTKQDAIYAGYLIERSEFEQEYGDAGEAIIDEFCLGKIDVAYDMMKLLSRVKRGLL